MSLLYSEAASAVKLPWQALVPVIPHDAQPAYNLPDFLTMRGKSPGAWFEREQGWGPLKNWRLGGNALPPEAKDWPTPNVGILGSYLPCFDLDLGAGFSDKFDISKCLIDAVQAETGWRGRSNSANIAIPFIFKPGAIKRRSTIWAHYGSQTQQVLKVEILGEGQQYLIAGTHASGAPYTFGNSDNGVFTSRVPGELGFPEIDETGIQQIIRKLETYLELRYGLDIIERHDAAVGAAVAVAVDNRPADPLRTWDVLSRILALIPNSRQAFPTHNDLLQWLAILRACLGTTGSQHWPDILTWALSGDGAADNSDPEGYFTKRWNSLDEIRVEPSAFDFIARRAARNVGVYDEVSRIIAPLAAKGQFAGIAATTTEVLNTEPVVPNPLPDTTSNAHVGAADLLLSKPGVLYDTVRSLTPQLLVNREGNKVAWRGPKPNFYGRTAFNDSQAAKELYAALEVWLAGLTPDQAAQQPDPFDLIACRMAGVSKVDAFGEVYGQPEIFTTGHGEVLYNNWRDTSPITHPVPVLDDHPIIKLFTAHMEYVCHDPDDVGIFTDWIAFLLQNITELPKFIPVLVGPGGIGKSMLAKIVMRLVGEKDTLTVDNRASIFGEFTGIYTRRLCVFEELNASSLRSEDIENFKASTGAKAWSKYINPKYGIPYTLDKCLLTFMVLSNSDAPFPKELIDNRRIYITGSLDTPIRDTAYFDQLGATFLSEQAPPNLGVLKRWLLDRDLTTFNALSRAPTTKMHAEAIAASTPIADLAVSASFANRHQDTLVMDRNSVVQDISIALANRNPKLIPSDVISRTLTVAGFVKLPDKTFTRRPDTLTSGRRPYSYSSLYTKSTATAVLAMLEAKKDGISESDLTVRSLYVRKEFLDALQKVDPLAHLIGFRAVRELAEHLSPGCTDDVLETWTVLRRFSTGEKGEISSTPLLRNLLIYAKSKTFIDVPL